MPISSYADHSYFKLYLADIGLLRKMSKLPASSILEKSEIFKEFKGALTENYALNELIYISGDVPYYWKSNNSAEVDFIIQFEIDIIPIEVKSERNVKARSLAEYIKKYNPKVAIKTSMKNISGDEVKNIPLYLIWNIYKLIRRN